MPGLTPLQVLESCAKRWPKAFNEALPRPLARGIRAELAAALGVSPAVVGRALAVWTSRDAYLKACCDPWAQRWALEGAAVERVSREHRAWAKSVLKEREQRKSVQRENTAATKSKSANGRPRDKRSAPQLSQE